MVNAFKIGAASAAALLIAISAFFITTARAQGPSQTPAPPQRYAIDYGPVGAIVADQSTLYVLRGNTVFRISKASMKVTGTASIPSVGVIKPGEYIPSGGN